jgi:hypothetical protein
MFQNGFIEKYSKRLNSPTDPKNYILIISEKPIEINLVDFCIPKKSVAF